MRTLFTILLLFMFSIQYAQNKNYPKKSQKFSRHMARIKQNNDVKFRMNSNVDYVRRYNLYTDELIDMCYYISNENYKLNLCASAYQNIIDKDNFYRVYDVFNRFSAAIRLYHLTEANQSNFINDNPTYDDGMVDAIQFKRVQNSFEEIIGTKNKIDLAKNFILNYNFIIEQYVEIVKQLSFDTDRLEILKFIVKNDKTHESVDLLALKKVLTFDTYKAKFTEVLLQDEERE